MYIPRKSKKIRLPWRKKKKTGTVSGEHFSFSSDMGERNWSPEKRKKILKTIGILCLAFVLLVLTTFAWYSKDLPNPYKINNRDIAQSTKILDRNGNLLYEVHGEEKRTLIKFEDIPENVKKATIAIEDQDFYKHSGFNLKGIARAFLQDIVSRRADQGGSTITQQYVKNALLTKEKSITRKIKEFILSVQIEKIYSKNEILGMYLNEIPYGNNAYGINAAAKTYFDKEVSDLTLAETSMLAALPQAPTFYNPYGSNYEKLIGRKDYVLYQMLSLELITKEEYEEAKAEEIKLKEQDLGILAPHFVIYVREMLAEKYGDARLENEGFVVTTSLDLEKQKIAEDVIASQKDYMNSKGTNNASLVAMDPKTGEILAMVGSIDYFAPSQPEGCTSGVDCKFEPNVNVALRLRQPGSSLKPIVYAAAFEKGYSPATMLMDVETDFGQGYIPKNYDGRFRGPVSIRKSLGNSLNIPAVKALDMVGVKTATDLAQKMGIASLSDPDRYGLSMVLGGGEVKLIESTTAYASLANGGVKHDPRPILKVVDGRGKVLEEYKKEEDEGVRVLNENIAYLVTNVLSDDGARVETFGAGGVLTLPGRPVAAKTGTTDEYRDAWTLGYTPSLVTGVWAGNNDNTTMDHAAGSMIAAPIWNAFMKQALAGTPVENFKVAPEIIRVRVDALTGKLPLEDIPTEIADQLPTREEVFWSKFPPKEVDDVHKIFRVIKGDEAYLADKECPLGMTDLKVFLEFNSVFKDRPNWQNPVIGWAQHNGYNTIPTEIKSCEDIEKESKPEIKINSPEKDETIGDELSVVVSFISERGLEKVEYFLNEEKIAEKKSGEPGNNFNLEKFVLPVTVKGKVVIKVMATDIIGLTAQDTIEVNVEH